MRLIKMFGLAAATAFIGMAFMGASSAMAVLDPETVICSIDVELCTAEGGTILPQNSIITATSLAAEPPVLLGSINQKCKESTIKTKITSVGGMGNPLEGESAGLTFSKECTPCTTVTATAGKGTLQMAGEVEGKPHWTLTSSGKTRFTGCPFGVECEFEAKEVKLLALNDLAAGGALFIANKAGPFKLIKGSAFFCGSEGTWDAHYVSVGHWLSSHKLPL